jgi:hypothetical protein
VGVRYEDRWTVSVLLDVLEGTAQSLYLEKPGPEAIGTEFCVMVDGVTIWHQAKRQLSEGPWNVARLRRKGQLASWWDKLRRGDRFVFVSRTSPDDLEELTERARSAETWAVFDEHFLGRAHRDAFDLVRECWGDPPEEAVYHALRNVQIEVVNEKRLITENRRRLASLVSGDPAMAAALLEQLVLDSVHRSLTADSTWDALAEHGFEPAPLPGSATVVGPAASADVVRWQPGTEIDVGPASYLLHDHLLAEAQSPDGSVVRRARALRIDANAPRDGRFVWVRQVEEARGPGRERLEAMVEEQRLLGELGDVRGLPKLVQVVVTPQRTTLVLRWPASRDGSRPCDGLDSLLGASITDAWRLSRLLSGLAGLTRSLGRLHEQGVSHRDVGPHGVVLLDDGDLVLRDLGLAAHRPRAGEPTSGDPAPEQGSPGRTLPGPATDVYRLAALLYLVVVGQPPHPTSPLPVAGAAPALPPNVASVVDAALRSEPEDRPPLATLGAALQAGSRACA